MKSSNVVLKVVTGSYLLLFFVYLFLPLVFMSVVAFNTSSIPQVTPWEGFTFMWFGELFGDSQMWDGLINSFIVAFPKSSLLLSYPFIPSAIVPIILHNLMFLSS